MKLIPITEIKIRLTGVLTSAVSTHRKCDRSEPNSSLALSLSLLFFAKAKGEGLGGSSFGYGQTITDVFLAIFCDTLIREAMSFNLAIGLNYDIYRFAKIDSTNAHLTKLADEDFPEGTVVVADEQSAGRGRFGRKWESEPLSNLLFSVLLRPWFLDRDEIFILTFAAAVAVAEALEDVVRVKPELKWPNDVLLAGKKVCGILLETDFDADRLKYVVLGIGINVNQKSFPAEVAGKATSVSAVGGKAYDRDEILSSVLARLGSLYDIVRNRDFYVVMKRWRQRTRMLGKKVRVDLAGKIFEGICEAITDDGSIVVRTNEESKKFTAGEISLLEN